MLKKCVMFLLFIAVFSEVKELYSMSGEYGKELEITGEVGLKNCVDVVLNRNKLYVLSERALHIFDLANPGRPVKLSSLGGLGNVRQISVRNDVAYIASREDGLFIVDVKTPALPTLISHYDTIELATGIAVSDNLAFVACRTYGVELIDISDLSKLSHVSTIRTGEAQSLAYRDGFLYAGVWATKELVICNVKNAYKPEIVSVAKLDGYGDGVFVKDNLCYVATGHHGAAMKKNDESDPAFGAGHGMEIYDISDPAKPLLVSRIKTPKYYYTGYDMWDVEVSGHYAYLGDTWNGFFIIDVSDPAKPFFVAHRQLPEVQINMRKGVYPSPVCGFAVGDGYIYLAGGFSDLHVVKADELAKPVPVQEIRSYPLKKPVASSEKRFKVYECGSQVYSVALKDKTAFVAAGAGGLHLVEIPSMKKIGEYKSDGVVQDVKIYGNRLYLAEGQGGLSVWDVSSDGKLSLKRRYEVNGSSIKQVVIPPPGKYAMLHVGATIFQIVDVSNPAKIELVFKDSRFGLLYGYQISEGLIDGKYASCSWHVSGVYWYDLSGAKPVYADINTQVRMNPPNGLAIYHDKALIAGVGGKYIYVDIHDKTPLDKIPRYGIAGVDIQGKPAIYDDMLYLTNRMSGDITVIGINDITKPSLKERLNIQGNPGIVQDCGDSVLIPAGYQGLLLMKKPR